MPEPESFLPLKPRIFLMLMELTRKPAHGYALKEALYEASDGRLDLGPGTLYRSVKWLLDEGFTTEETGPGGDDGDERRRVYRITPLGRAVAAAEAQRLAKLVDAARAEKLIGP